MNRLIWISIVCALSLIVILAYSNEQNSIRTAKRNEDIQTIQQMFDRAAHEFGEVILCTREGMDIGVHEDAPMSIENIKGCMGSVCSPECVDILRAHPALNGIYFIFGAHGLTAKADNYSIR